MHRDPLEKAVYWVGDGGPGAELRGRVSSEGFRRESQGGYGENNNLTCLLLGCQRAEGYVVDDEGDVFVKFFLLCSKMPLSAFSSRHSRHKAMPSNMLNFVSPC